MPAGASEDFFILRRRNWLIIIIIIYYYKAMHSLSATAELVVMIMNMNIVWEKH